MKDSEFQLLSQRLTKTEFKINRKFSNKDKKIALKLSSNIKISKMKNKNEAFVIFKLNIFNKKELEKYPFYINLEIEGLFSWSKNINNIDKYLKVNAPAVLMSYLRSIVTQLTVSAGYPPLILPLIDFTKN
jgi:preprotein translocase subunit SecB